MAKLAARVTAADALPQRTLRRPSPLENGSLRKNYGAELPLTKVISA